MLERYQGHERRQPCDDGCVSMTDKLNTKADEMYCEINKRVKSDTFSKAMAIAVTVFLLMIGGAYAYTTLVSASLKDTIRIENDRQDKYMEKVETKLDRVLDKLDQLAGKR